MKTVLKKIGGFFKSVGRWFKNHAPTKRRLIQLYAALLTNANLKGFITGQIYTGGSKVMCVPGLNCYSCPGAIGACPLGSLQNALASSGTRAPVYVLGILALFGIILGRTICGFLCPMGLCQDLAYKIKTPKLKKSRATRILSYLKYILLVVLVIAVPLAFVGQERLIPAFCKFICPAGTFGGALSLLFHPDNADMYAMLGPMFTWKFALFCALFVACVFIYRAFCRFFCPLGAIYGFFNKIALLGVKLDKNKCTDCGLCVAHCKMDVKRVGDHECINCGECISVCPTKAIRWKGSQFFVRENETKAPEPSKAPLASMVHPAVAAEGVPAGNALAGRPQAQPVTLVHGESEKVRSPGFRIGPKGTRVFKAIVYTLAALLFAGALFYYNFVAEEPPRITVGTEPGDICSDFTAKIYDNATGELTEERYSLAVSEGKVTVINFWGTWCDPCKAELPYFDRVASEYENVVVVTVHSINGMEEAPAYISDNYPESKMIFIQDEEQGEVKDIFTLLGGTNAYPRTLILDSEGEITFTKTGSLGYERLCAEVENAIAQSEAKEEEAVTQSGLA